MTTLKYSDIKNRNKILLNVCWTKLSGNKYPYLSVDIKQVISEGVRIHGWDQQKQVIKKLDKDLYFLICSHLSDPNGFGLHMVANGIYHFELTKKHVMNRPVTLSDREVWTLERFADYSSLPIVKIKDLFFDDNYKNKLTEFFTKQASKAKIKLELLTKMYKLETVTQ